MNWMVWLLRAKRWAQNPPSLRQLVFVMAIVAAGLALAGIEWIWGWPEALTVNRPPKP